MMSVTRPAPPPEPSTGLGIPQTRDGVPTLSIEQRGTPQEPPLRFDLSHGEPSLAGWQSPVAPSTPRIWMSLLLLGSAAAVLTSWLLHGL